MHHPIPHLHGDQGPVVLEAQLEPVCCVKPRVDDDGPWRARVRAEVTIAADDDVALGQRVLRHDAADWVLLKGARDDCRKRCDKGAHPD